MIDPLPCGCLDHCDRENHNTYQHMASVATGGCYCKKNRGIPFKHRRLSDMERQQIESAERADDHAAKELCLAESALRLAQERRNRAAEILNHWVAFTANPRGKP
jgi:hypothetical protein